MDAKEFVDLFGGYMMVNGVVAKVNGRQEWVYKDGEITHWGRILISQAIKRQAVEEEPHKPKKAGGRRRNRYTLDEEDDYGVD